MGKKIDYATALKAVEGAIERKGADYIYKRNKADGNCLYTNIIPSEDNLLHSRFLDEDGGRYNITNIAPGCIMGHAGDDEGWFKLACVIENGQAIDQLLADCGHSLTDKASQFLYSVQLYQDRGHTWGKALAHGIASVNAGSGERYDDTEMSLALSRLGR